MKRRQNRAHPSGPAARPAGSGERPVTSRATSLGVFTGATLAALLAASPLNFTVSLSPEPHTVAVGQGADTPNPLCRVARN